MHEFVFCQCQRQPHKYLSFAFVPLTYFHFFFRLSQHDIRQLTRGSTLNRLCDLCYHLTLSIRFFWQPYLIYHFRHITHMDQGYTVQEHCMVMISQIMLCIFNILIVSPGLMPKKKKNSKAEAYGTENKVE